MRRFSTGRGLPEDVTYEWVNSFTSWKQKLPFERQECIFFRIMIINNDFWMIWVKNEKLDNRIS